MATYVIGDIQGCYDSLQALLKAIEFDSDRDHICLVGDLTTRGPKSLEVLLWAKGMGDSVSMVLGNHDLHLIAYSKKEGAKNKYAEYLDPIMDSDSGEELVIWLRQQPLIRKIQDHLIVHAGILPKWKAEQAFELSDEISEVLKSKKYKRFLKYWYQNSDANLWFKELQGWDRLCVALSAFTRMRVCKNKKKMKLNFTGTFDEVPEGASPWFQMEGRKTEKEFVIFGHWAAGGHLLGANYAALDSGCVYGGKLTAFRLEDHKVIQVDCQEEPFAHD